VNQLLFFLQEPFKLFRLTMKASCPDETYLRMTFKSGIAINELNFREVFNMNVVNELDFDWKPYMFSDQDMVVQITILVDDFFNVNHVGLWFED
jgi:hypothetical protein